MSYSNRAAAWQRALRGLKNPWASTLEFLQAVEGLSEAAKGALLKSIFEERSVTEKTRLKHVKAK